MDEYKSRLSSYLQSVVREELGKYDGGFMGGKGIKEGVNEEILKEDIQDLKKIVKELEGASKMHSGQAKRIQSHLDSMNVKEAMSNSEIKKMKDEFKKTGELPPHLKKLVKGKKDFEKRFNLM